MQNFDEKLIAVKKTVGRYALFDDTANFLHKVETALQGHLIYVVNEHFHHFLPKEMLLWYYELIDDHEELTWSDFKKLFVEESFDLEYKQIKLSKLSLYDYWKTKIAEDSQFDKVKTTSPVSSFVNDKIQMKRKISQSLDQFDLRFQSCMDLPEDLFKSVRKKFKADEHEFQSFLSFLDSKYLKMSNSI